MGIWGPSTFLMGFDLHGAMHGCVSVWMCGYVGACSQELSKFTLICCFFEKRCRSQTQGWSG